MLITICGFPCTGKSVIAQVLAHYIRIRFPTSNILIINEESLSIDKITGYSSSNSEKITRATLKSQVNRNLQGDAFVILDSLNYNKGYRYELYCQSRAQQNSRHCCVFVSCCFSLSEAWNEKRISRHSNDALNDVRNRFEMPNPDHRWDNPLFSINMDLYQTAESFNFDCNSSLVSPELIDSLQPVITPIMDWMSTTTSQSSARPLLLLDDDQVEAKTTCDTDLNSVTSSILSSSSSSSFPICLDLNGCISILTRPVSSSELIRHKRSFLKSGSSSSYQEFIAYLNIKIV